MDLVIRGARVCTPDGIRDGWDVVISNGKIKAVEPTRKDESRGPRHHKIVDASGRYLLPGFIDVHLHGAELFEFTAGYFQPETGRFDNSDESWRRGLPAYARFLARTGVTSACLATWAAPVEQLARSFGFLADYMSADGNGADGARFLGGNLEGTFINPGMAGAQNPSHTLDPDRKVFDAINRAGAIRMANICPDRGGDAALDLIGYVRQKGIMPGFGHTNATGDQVAEAVRRGLRYCVHFLNGPIGGSHKPFGGAGAIEAVLRSREIYAELITDTYHVLSAYLRDTIRRKGSDRVMAVTDQMFATGAPGVSGFTISGIRGQISPDRRYVHVADKPGTLFSSVLQMHIGFGNVLSLLTREMEGVWNAKHDPLPLDEAIMTASRLFSTTAAEMLTIDDDAGAISPGKRADLVISHIKGRPGEYTLGIERTYVGGRQVF